MGASTSCSSPSTPTPDSASVEEVQKATHHVLRNAKAVIESGRAEDALTFTLLSLTGLDNAVRTFVANCQKQLHSSYEEILTAYYDATQKASNAALMVQRHANYAATELKMLRAVAKTYSNGDGSRNADAVEVLKQVEVDKLGLPASLVGMLEDAQAAYKKVILLCQDRIDALNSERTNVGLMVGLVAGTAGFIALGVCLCVFCPPAGAVVASVGTHLGVSISTTVASVAAATLGAGAVIVGAALAAELGKYISELIELANRIEEQQKLLRTANAKAVDIMSSIDRIKHTVQVIQNKLKVIADDASIALKLNYLDDITTEAFLEDLEKQLSDLENLSKTCDELHKKVKDAYDFFCKHPEFHTNRIKDEARHKKAY